MRPLGAKLRRIRAVVWADFLIRFRRPSTLVVFLLLSWLAYLWVPDPASGQALLVLDGRRALYDSAAMAVSTAILCSLLLGLAGFYLVSHTLGRDVRTGAGFVIASTPVTDGEYLLGKLAGNALLLSSIAAGYMVSSMAMQAVRGEAPIEPAVYLWHYGLLVPSSLLTVSALALWFESVPWLSGKVGDVLFFIVWLTALGLTAALHGISSPGAGPGALDYLDPGGLGYVVSEVTRTLKTASFSIGASGFDASLPPRVFGGLGLPRGWGWARLTSSLVWVPIFGLARLGFHRFDPERVRLRPSEQGRGWLRKLDAALRPLTRWLVAPGLHGMGRRPSLANAVVADIALTFTESPRALAALVAVAVLSLTLPSAAVDRALLPIAFLVFALVVAGIASREERAGTRGLIAAMPGLGTGLALWKLAGSVVLAGGFLGPLALRLAVGEPARALTVLGGALWVASAATALDLLTGTPKTFLLLFLSFWYVVLNDGGAHPGLDFGGFFGPARGVGWVVYPGLAVLSFGLAWIAERHRRARL